MCPSTIDDCKAERSRRRKAAAKLKRAHGTPPSELLLNDEPLENEMRHETLASHPELKAVIVWL